MENNRLKMKVYKKNNQEERGSKRKNKKERRFRKPNSIRANSRPVSLAASHTWRGNTRVAGNWEIRDIRENLEFSGDSGNSEDSEDSGKNGFMWQKTETLTGRTNW